MNYSDFIEDKIISTPRTGFEVASDDEFHGSLFPHQRDVVRWAAEGGRRAIFASFGLGKTRMQLELARLTIAKHPGRALIICPRVVAVEVQAVRRAWPQPDVTRRGFIFKAEGRWHQNPKL